jgi:hypothetical protein
MDPKQKFTLSLFEETPDGKTIYYPLGAATGRGFVLKNKNQRRLIRVFITALIIIAVTISGIMGFAGVAEEVTGIIVALFMFILFCIYGAGSKLITSKLTSWTPDWVQAGISKNIYLQEWLRSLPVKRGWLWGLEIFSGLSAMLMVFFVTVQLEGFPLSSKEAIESLIGLLLLCFFTGILIWIKRE